MFKKKLFLNVGLISLTLCGLAHASSYLEGLSEEDQLAIALALSEEGDSPNSPSLHNQYLNQCDLTEEEQFAIIRALEEEPEALLEEEDHSPLKAQEESEEEYTSDEFVLVASTLKNISETFDQEVYKKINSEGRFAFLAEDIIFFLKNLENQPEGFVNGAAEQAFLDKDREPFEKRVCD